MIGDELPPDLQAALWAGNGGSLRDICPCICCCHEHTFPQCPARLWWGCRGQGNVGEEYEEWKRAFPELKWEE